MARTFTAAEVEQLQTNLMAAQWNCFHWEQRALRAEAKALLTPKEREAIEYLMMGGCEGPGAVEIEMRDIARAMIERLSKRDQ